MSNTFSPESRRAERLADQLDRIESGDAEIDAPDATAVDEHSHTPGLRSRATESVIWVIAAVMAVAGVIQLVQPNSVEDVPALPPAVVQAQPEIKIHRLWFGEPTNRGGKLFMKLSADTANTPNDKTLSVKLVSLKTGLESALGSVSCESYNDSTAIISECAVSYAHTKANDPHKLTVSLKTDDGSIITKERFPVDVPNTHGTKVSDRTARAEKTPQASPTAHQPANVIKSMDVVLDAATASGIHYTINTTLDTETTQSLELPKDIYLTNLQTRVRHLVESNTCSHDIDGGQRVDQCVITLSKPLPDTAHQLVVEVNLSGTGVVSARSIQFQTR